MPHLLCQRARVAPRILAEPSLLTFFSVNLFLGREGFPKLDGPGPPMEVRAMRIGRLGKAHVRIADIGDHCVHDVEHGRRRPEARLDRQIAELESRARPRIFACFEKRDRLLANPVPRPLEFVRIGPLEAEDRLLEIPDHEERSAPPLARALAREKFGGERLDDLPLRAIGVLAFVDEDVVGAPVELVADPFPHARGLEQLPSPGDQIIE
ncbi:MAG: hypothetical protein M3Y34_00940, partial [Actinomycetota bacterium]|nr:hypothetical protein [Actinomycetota bacterium]